MGLDETQPWAPEPLAPGALGADRPSRPSPMAAASRRPEPPPIDVCAAIEAALAAAATVLDGGASTAQLLDRARGLARLVNLAQAELARTVAHAESVDAAYADGLTGMRPWLRGHTAATGPEAAAVLASGRLARRMPAVGAAAAAGGIGAGQLAVIGRILTDDVWATGDAVGADLRRWMPWSPHRGARTPHPGRCVPSYRRCRRPRRAAAVRPHRGPWSSDHPPRRRVPCDPWAARRRRRGAGRGRTRGDRRRRALRG